LKSKKLEYDGSNRIDALCSAAGKPLLEEGGRTPEASVHGEV